MAVILLILNGPLLKAATHFVNLSSSNPTLPYSSWDTAANTIQDAIDAATDGDVILVTNGVYDTGGRVVRETLTNRVSITKPLTVESVNGPAVTIIEGYQVPGVTNGDGAIRGVYMTNNTALIGFTITHGATHLNVSPGYDEDGGGVFCENLTNSVVSNCVIIANSASAGGGVQGGTLNNCVVASNSDLVFVGGTLYSTLNDCLVVGNYSAGSTGGVYGSPGTGAPLTNFTATSANNCRIIGNSSANTAGGANQMILNNCVIAGNQGPGAYASRLYNCTVVGNSIGIEYSPALNCIIYYNTNGNYAPSDDFHIYCCSTPASGYDFGNITNEPAFVDAASGDYHLQPGSPCINSGNNIFLEVTNNIGAPPDQLYFTLITNDFDGGPRIAGATVDIGAFEFQSPASVISYAWLLKNDLPIDGSADYADPDDDGMNNWQEWRSGTDPMDAGSALRMLSLARGVPGMTIKWQGETNITYFLERSVDLAAPFSIIQSNISGQTGTNVYTDTTATGGAYFYRVGVQ